MPPRVALWWEGYVTGLSDAGFTFTRIIEMCKRRNFKISKSVIHRICQQSKAGLPSDQRGTPVVRRKRKAPSRTESVVERVKELVTSDNPDTNKNIAQCVGVSKTTVGRIITETLGIVKRPVKKRKTPGGKIKSKHQCQTGQATTATAFARGKVHQRTGTSSVAADHRSQTILPQSTTTTTSPQCVSALINTEQPSNEYLFSHSPVYPNNCTYPPLPEW